MWLACLSGFEFAPVLSFVGMSLTLALYSSISHELIHGHPTRSRCVNMAFGFIPLTLVYPIHLFRETHLKHHHDEDLTIPGIDPESFFHCPIKWQEKSRIARLYAWVNMTLSGRLLCSLPNTLVQVARYFIRDMRYGNLTKRAIWIVHFALVILVCAMVVELGWMPLEVYLLCAWIGHMIIAFRAFFEHRPAQHPSHRIVIVRSNWFFSFIYLSNNYHAVHHQFPKLPWYEIPRVYKARDAEILSGNSQFYFHGYFRWLAFLFKPVHSPVHPGMLKQSAS